MLSSTFFDSSALANTRPGKKRFCSHATTKCVSSAVCVEPISRDLHTLFCAFRKNAKRGSLGTGMYTVTVVGTIHFFSFHFLFFLLSFLFIFFFSRVLGTMKRPILLAHISFPRSVAQTYWCLSLFFCLFTKRLAHGAENLVRLIIRRLPKQRNNIVHDYSNTRRTYIV